ncbi:efflux transporter outer membrane subunit [Phenylobacterium sp.]|uniref:efflux transporter outer membrane subunit n=1 Tax=Phenylobacterium sp. TaxID=1871053 RepID=UPI0025E62F13|nr:efflux transporter outer membrane subunit [Phenylobacterium sp.]
MTQPRTALALLACAALAGCAVGPNYARPSAPISPAYKEAEGWSPAAPADALDRGDWWTLFGDPGLDGLETRVKVSNQNIAAAEAAYRQARALVSEQRAALFPTVSLTGGGTRSGNGGGGGTTVINPDGTTTTTGGAGGSRTTYRASLGATWEPDVWGRIRRAVEGAKASAQASDADLANATLSAQGELAADYFGLRETDAELALDQATVEGYRRTVQITRNRFNAGTIAHSDLLQAQTQLSNAQADLAGAQRQRATYEHAIAVLVGEAPGSFALAAAAWTADAPAIPPGVPSTLLQRRPDIAAAERRMADANAQIGVARAAYFPTLTLNGSYGFAASSLGALFNASNSLWSYGLSAAETLFDGGARQARVKGARAAYDQTVAQYRQTVLTALQDVEDQLVASRVLDTQYALRREASTAADAAEAMVNNRYQAGQVSYVEVFTAQTAAYAARRALAQAQAQRQTTAVALIQALGGGWRSR